MMWRKGVVCTASHIGVNRYACCYQQHISTLWKTQARNRNKRATEMKHITKLLEVSLLILLFLTCFKQVIIFCRVYANIHLCHPSLSTCLNFFTYKNIWIPVWKLINDYKLFSRIKEALNRKLALSGWQFFKFCQANKTIEAYLVKLSRSIFGKSNLNLDYYAHNIEVRHFKLVWMLSKQATLNSKRSSLSGLLFVFLWGKGEQPILFYFKRSLKGL